MDPTYHSRSIQLNSLPLSLTSGTPHVIHSPPNSTLSLSLTSGPPHASTIFFLPLRPGKGARDAQLPRRLGARRSSPSGHPAPAAARRAVELAPHGGAHPRDGAELALGVAGRRRRWASHGGSPAASGLARGRAQPRGRGVAPAVAHPRGRGACPTGRGGDRGGKEKKETKAYVNKVDNFE